MKRFFDANRIYLGNDSLLTSIGLIFYIIVSAIAHETLQNFSWYVSNERTPFFEKKNYLSLEVAG